MISIAGGVYAERCKYPAWDQIYGSGLRAAIAASSVSDRVRLHAYVPTEWTDDIASTLASFGVLGEFQASNRPMTFEYLHAFEPYAMPLPLRTPYPDLVIQDEVVLRFGMLEGDARVTGSRVVYDPQSSNASFHANGSMAGSLAMIVSGRELLSLMPAYAQERPSDEPERHMPDEDVLLAAIVAQRDLPQSPQVVLVKDGLGGLTVFQGDQPVRVPSYAAESFFRIGSGDVTAAAFAHAWGERHWDPVDAAHYAARCTAHFVEGPRLPLPTPDEVSARVPSTARREELRILGLDDFEVQMLVLRTRSWLTFLGGNVLMNEPLGLNDLRSRASEVVDLLLVGSHCDVLDLVAIASSGLRPTVVFWPSADKRLSERYFPDSVVARDYATALYLVMRSPKR